MSGKRTVEDVFRLKASSSDVTQERERNFSGSLGSVDIPTISRSSSLMSLGSEPEDSQPGSQPSDQGDVVIAGGCSISSQELQTIKDKMAALTNYYKFSHVVKSKNAPDTSSKVLGKTIKVYNLKAKCQKCFAEVSFWNNTTGNLVSHYKTKHTRDLSELKAAISRTSRRGLKHPTADDQLQRHQLSLKENSGQAARFTQDKKEDPLAASQGPVDANVSEDFSEVTEDNSKGSAFNDLPSTSFVLDSIKVERNADESEQGTKSFICSPDDCEDIVIKEEAISTTFEMESDTDSSKVQPRVSNIKSSCSEEDDEMDSAFCSYILKELKKIKNPKKKRELKIKIFAEILNAQS